MNKSFTKYIFGLFTFIAILGISSATFGAATITIFNNDAAGVGFNDATVVQPVGGNPGTTLGQQRLNAFQAAANVWGATIDSTVPIVIKSQWTTLTCTATSAVLGSAGSQTIHRNFNNAPFTNTWYGGSLANKLNGADLVANDPATPTSYEINANFNVNLGNTGCLDGTPFYLGLDANHGTAVDLQTVLEHEFAHGLGFQTFTTANTGAQNSGFPSVYDRFLTDDTSGKTWVSMTNAERAASTLNTHKLSWNGPIVTAAVPSVLSFGIPVLKIASPASIAANYDVGLASFGPALTAGGITGTLVMSAPVDGCTALTNGAAVTGKVAVINRGTCSFKTKTLNAQNAGAIAVVIVNNAAGSPAPGLGDDATITTPITIPTVSVTQSDGALITAQLANNVTGTVQLDTTVRAGADAIGKALLYTPNPFASGSSVSHWDTIAFPNLLMEPNINGDLTHNVTTPSDLTFQELSDVGWVTQALPNTITKLTGDAQVVSANAQVPVPLSVTTTPAVAGLTVVFTAVTGTNGSSGVFVSSPPAGIAPSATSAVPVNVGTATTNAAGVATAPTLATNGQAGIFTVNASVPGAGSTTYTITSLAPTAASVGISGRVYTPGGAGLRNAIVTVTKANGVKQAVATGSFGYFNFTGLQSGETVVISISSKNYRFQPSVLSLTEDLSNLSFVALP